MTSVELALAHFRKAQRIDRVVNNHMDGVDRMLRTIAHEEIVRGSESPGQQQQQQQQQL